MSVSSENLRSISTPERLESPIGPLELVDGAPSDITVYGSDQDRAPGHLSRQGPPALRWALCEPAQIARRPGSPDRESYTRAAERLGGNCACVSVARKLPTRSFHTLRDLGEEALAPA
jgi:transposase